jgi:predicted RNA-binding Zn ribbon-like protein
MELPTWVDPEEDKPAPMPLLRVQSFVNTLDVAQDRDLLRDVQAAREWLADVGLIAPGTLVSATQLQEARSVREAVRALIAHNGGGPPPAQDQLATLRALTSRRRPIADVEHGGRITLRVSETGELPDGLLGLLLTIRDAQDDGSWARLKLCENPDCRWAFFDSSRNRQGAWCTMAACGNRLKNRRFRARRRDHEPAGGG